MQFEFNYDCFVEAFDSDLPDGKLEWHVSGWDEPHREIFHLGREFRKKYVKEAA